MLILTTISLWISVFLLRLNFVYGVECQGQTLRYHTEELLVLKNCTSILGSLTIMSMQETKSLDGINNYTFPQLKEITGYLLLFNIIGLNSTGKWFPNLSVIRGNHLIQSYSLIIFGLPHLTEVGFKSLISIQRGYVFIERCPSLCYQNTVDWEAITEEDEEDLGAGKGNVIQEPAPKCPTKESCRQCRNDNCWSPFNCQKSKMSHYGKGVNKCHKLCLGECANNTAAGCNVCSKLKYNDECVDECPSDLLLFRDTMRCITKLECLTLGLIPFNGECRKQCPDSYSQYNPETKQLHYNECFKCEIKCIKKCFGIDIRGPSDLEFFRGCTIVEGTLSIKLGLNMTDINEKLEETLGNIETINGALKIYRSFSLTSLSFFRNLNTINADNATFHTKDRLSEYRNPYAIEITENDNLQTLFDWKEKLQFVITGGGMSFHFNSKLCMNEIHSFQDITQYDRTHDSIGYDTNGYDEICHATGIFAFDIVDSHSSARIYWNITDFGSNKTLIGYFVYYIEAPSRNINYFSGLDACSTKKFRPSKNTDMPMISRRTNSEIWQSKFVPFEDLNREKGFFEMTVTNLKQYTQYAYYIRTQLSLKIRDQLLNVTQGQSQVKYFKTLPDRPRPPIVRTQYKTNVSLTLEWIPSTPENELVQKYFVDVYVLADDVDEIDNRDYCHNPKVNDDKKEDDTKMTDVICCRDQRAYLEFFQRDSNQTCGPSDPTCELTYKFVLFHHHVENALLKANPSKRHLYKEQSYKSPTHHNGTEHPIKRKYGAQHSKYYLHSHIIDNTATQSILVPSLKPFTMYAFYVYACNNVSNCSDYYFHSDRTLPYYYADDIDIVSIPDPERTDVITMIVQPPIEPNGVTVAYEIESYDYGRNIYNVKCITRKKMKAMNYTIRYENLLYGTHSFRVRSLSLGMDGAFSDWVVIRVDQVSSNAYNWGIGMAFIAIFSIIVSVTTYRKCRNYRNLQGSDVEHLLSERRASDQSISTVPAPRRTRQLHSAVRRPSRTAEPEALQQQASEGIPMAVFRSNVSDSTLSPPPSTSSDLRRVMYPTIQESTIALESNSSLLRRFIRTLEASSEIGKSTEMDDTSMEENLLSAFPKTRQRFTSETDYE